MSEGVDLVFNLDRRVWLWLDGDVVVEEMTEEVARDRLGIVYRHGSVPAVSRSRTALEGGEG